MPFKYGNLISMIRSVRFSCVKPGQYLDGGPQTNTGFCTLNEIIQSEISFGFE